MLNINTCVGSYAVTPYFIQSLGIRVYCMEELCYCLKENAFLLDTEIMSDSLITWIEQDCELSDLAKVLHNKVHEQGSLSSYIITILKYVGFYDDTILDQVQQTLKKGAGLSVLERQKIRLDTLVRDGKYAMAIQGYGELIEDCEMVQMTAKEQEIKSEEGLSSQEGMLAALFHNRGTAYAVLMHYQKAASDYWRAYELDCNMESLNGYLAAKRMELKKEDYIALAAELANSLDASLRLEENMVKLEEGFCMEAEAIHLEQRNRFRQEGQLPKYYEDNESLIHRLKDSYRSNVSR